MPSKAASYKQGMRAKAGRARSSTNGVGGNADSTLPLGKTPMLGRRNMSAADPAAYGNRLHKVAGAKKHSYK